MVQRILYCDTTKRFGEANDEQDSEVVTSTHATSAALRIKRITAKCIYCYFGNNILFRILTSDSLAEPLIAHN